MQDQRITGNLLPRPGGGKQRILQGVRRDMRGKGNQMRLYIGQRRLRPEGQKWLHHTAGGGLWLFNPWGTNLRINRRSSLPRVPNQARQRDCEKGNRNRQHQRKLRQRAQHAANTSPDAKAQNHQQNLHRGTACKAHNCLAMHPFAPRARQILWPQDHQPKQKQPDKDRHHMPAKPTQSRQKRAEIQERIGPHQALASVCHSAPILAQIARCCAFSPDLRANRPQSGAHQGQRSAHSPW